MCDARAERILGTLVHWGKYFQWRPDGHGTALRYLAGIRRILGVNYAAVWLRDCPHGGQSRWRLLKPQDQGKENRMVADSEIGNTLLNNPRMLYKRCLNAGQAAMREEFERARCEVAIPIQAAETLVGFCLLGNKVSNAPLSARELLLSFQLLEQLAEFLHDSADRV